MKKKYYFSIMHKKPSTNIMQFQKKKNPSSKNTNVLSLNFLCAPPHVILE